MPPWTRHPVVRSALISVGSLLMWGGWAFLVNRGHGFGAGATAAGVQGFSSLTVTFFMTLLMEGVVRWTPGDWAGIRRGGLVALAGLGFQVAYTLVLHVLGGTPELWVTVAPLIVSGAVYCVVYAAALERERVGAVAVDPA